jgi:hypothetical protein
MLVKQISLTVRSRKMMYRSSAIFTGHGHHVRAHGSLANREQVRQVGLSNRFLIEPCLDGSIAVCLLFAHAGSCFVSFAISERIGTR